MFLLKDAASLFRADVNPEFGENDRNDPLPDWQKDEHVVSSLASEAMSIWLPFFDSDSSSSQMSENIFSLLEGVDSKGENSKFES